MGAHQSGTTTVSKQTHHKIDKPSYVRVHSFRQSLKIGLRIALLIHLLFIPLFLAIDVSRLALFNMFSATIYIFALRYFKNNQVRRAINLAWIELVSHAITAVLLLGWESGFQFYLILLVAYIMINTSRSYANRISVTLLVCLLYLGLDFRHPLRLDEKTDIRLSITLGVSSYHADENIHTCISRADQAMYQRKKAGKNRVQTTRHIQQPQPQ